MAFDPLGLVLFAAAAFMQKKSTHRQYLSTQYTAAYTLI